MVVDAVTTAQKVLNTLTLILDEHFEFLLCLRIRERFDWRNSISWVTYTTCNRVSGSILLPYVYLRPSFRVSLTLLMYNVSIESQQALVNT